MPVTLTIDYRFFAHLKTGELNPDGAAVGKRAFKTLGELVMAKAAAIRPSTVVKFWRHSALELFKHVQLRKVGD